MMPYCDTMEAPERFGHGGRAADAGFAVHEEQGRAAAHSRCERRRRARRAIAASKRSPSTPSHDVPELQVATRDERRLTASTVTCRLSQDP